MEAFPRAAVERKPGLVCTFYSYKGGVGRSMALANVAALLARLGQKVLVIDWDLEAPGIEQYFGPHYRTSRKSTKGLVDLVGSYATAEPLNWRTCILKATVMTAIVASSTAAANAQIDIIHAGLDDPGYSGRMRALNWDTLFDKGFGRALETMRTEWITEYDYVFIDSRTGITDIGGICTILLPDYLISLFTTNEQSILGVKDAMTRASAAQENLPLDRQRMIVIPIAARDESSTEYKRAAEWRKRFALELSKFYDEWIHKDETAETVLDYLKIPYVAYWSFGEQLPVLEEDATNPKTLAYSYTLIARLIHSRLNWSEVREGRETSELQARRDAEVQGKLAEAAKLRTEALSQQQAEATRALEERNQVLLRRFEQLVADAGRKRQYFTAWAAAAVIALGAIAAAYLFGVVPDAHYQPIMITLGVVAYGAAGLVGWCFLRILRFQRIGDGLQRENAAYKIGHGRYADLSGEARLRLFGDRIERIAADDPVETDTPPDLRLPSPVAATRTGEIAPPSQPPLPTETSRAAMSVAAPPPTLTIDESSPIDVLVVYPREGIASEWAREFLPLFSRWLSDLLGRNTTIVDASPFLAAGDIANTLAKGISIARTAVVIMSGRPIESERMLMQHFSRGQLFPIRLGPATRSDRPRLRRRRVCQKRALYRFSGPGTQAGFARRGSHSGSSRA